MPCPYDLGCIMNRYLIRRLLVAVPTLIGISFVIFAVVNIAPNDPMSQFALNPAVPPEVRANIRDELGLDDPWPLRYVKWLGSAVQATLGSSFSRRLPVLTLLSFRLPSQPSGLGVA